MTLKNPLFLENLTYSATDMRGLIDDLFTPGVIGSGLAVTQHAGTANRSVDVALGVCYIAGTDLAGQKKYRFESTAVVNVPLAAAPSSGNSRISLIVAQVLDDDQNGGSQHIPEIVEVAGTPATTGSQVAPATPATALLLATVLVGPTVTTIVTANITDARIQATDAVIASNTLVGQAQYSGSQVYNSLNTFGFSAIDATNLTMSLTVPLNGKIKFKASCFATLVENNATGTAYIALAFALHGGAVLSPAERVISLATGVQASGAAVNISDRVTYEAVATGLTPGALQVDLCAFVVVTGSGVAEIISDNGSADTSFGPVLLEAYSTL